MTVLVTGGAGFIGSHVVEALVAHGESVRVLDSLRTDVHGDEPDLSAVTWPDVELRVGDVTDRAAVTEALEGCESVIHLAAKVGLGVDFDDTEDYVHTNDTGTAVLLAAMARVPVDRLVLASSMVVYGDGAWVDADGRPCRPCPRTPRDLASGRFEPRGPEGTPLLPALVDEEAPLDPQNVYAATKLHQEHLATVWARATGGRAGLLRFHNVYGPRMPFGTPYAGVASIFRSALERGEAPTVLEDGRQRRDFVHVRDVADAVLATLGWTLTTEPRTARPFNVGSGQVHTIGDLGRAMSAAVGGPEPVVTGGSRPGDVRHVTASSDRIRDEMGWSARVPFADGVAELAVAPLRGRPRIARDHGGRRAR